MSYLLTNSWRSKVAFGCATEEEIAKINDAISFEHELFGLNKIRNASLVQENTMTLFLEKHGSIILIPGEVDRTLDLAFEFFDGETKNQISVHTWMENVEKDSEHVFVEVKIESPWSNEIRKYLSYYPEAEVWAIHDPEDWTENGDKDITGTSDEILETLINLLWRV